jgi:capsular polysaccharide biosynthesis protein
LTAGDVYRALWRHKILIIALTAVFVSATWYLVSRETRQYDASTLVRVEERGPNAGDASTALLAGQTLAQDYATLINADALDPGVRALLVACLRPTNRFAPSSVCRSVGEPTAIRFALGRLPGVRMSASQVQNLDLLTITARSESKAVATIAANAAPPALRTFIRKGGSASERVIVAKPATPPSSPASRQLPFKLVLAVMVGLLFNGALVLLFELFRDRLPETDELGNALGQPVLATIPGLRLNRVETLSKHDPTSVPS